MILDEPTNHLDMVSKEILEQALNRYTGTVFFVSHDRYFINQTATRILDLTGQTIVNYIGNYDYYLEKQEELTRIYAPHAKTGSASSQSLQAADTSAEEGRLCRAQHRLAHPGNPGKRTGRSRKSRQPLCEKNKMN